MEDYQYRGVPSAQDPCLYIFRAGEKMMKDGRHRSCSTSYRDHPPRLGVSGLSGLPTEARPYRNYSTGGLSLSPPPDIPAPPPPVDSATLGRLRRLHPSSLHHHHNGHIAMIDNRKTAMEISHELTQRISELSRERAVEPPDSMSHLQLTSLPDIPHLPCLVRQHRTQDNKSSLIL